MCKYTLKSVCGRVFLRGRLCSCATRGICVDVCVFVYLCLRGVPRFVSRCGCDRVCAYVARHRKQHVYSLHTLSVESFNEVLPGLDPNSRVLLLTPEDADW